MLFCIILFGRFLLRFGSGVILGSFSCGVAVRTLAGIGGIGCVVLFGLASKDASILLFSQSLLTVRVEDT